MGFKNFVDNKKQVGSLFFYLSLLLFALIISYSLLKPFVGYDDYYTLGIIRYSFMDMISTTASNVHPPLYYIILKVFTKLFNPLDNLSLILLGKIVSILPIGLILLLSFTKIRKEFGFLVSGVFSFLICSSFSIMYYASVIRMYSWGLLFITVELIYFYEIIHKRSNKPWIFFTITSICAIYTHYFVAISTIILYLVLFVYLIYSKRELLKFWFVSSIVSFISYLPWIRILLNQINSVEKNYWIKDITFNNILEYINFIFAPNSNLLGIFLEILLIIAILVLIYIGFKNRKYGDKPFVFAIISISLVFLTILTGVFLSLIIRPIFVSRYILPCCGGICLGFSILISIVYDNCFKNENNTISYNSKGNFSKNENKNIPHSSKRNSSKNYNYGSDISFRKDYSSKFYRNITYFVLILIVVVALFSSLNFINQTDLEYNDTLKNYEFFDTVSDDKVVIFEDKLSYLRYSPFIKNSTLVYDKGFTHLDKYLNDSNEIVVFNKVSDLDSKKYNLDKIYTIYQDDVYLIEN